MWKLTPDFQNIVGLQSASRFEKLRRELTQRRTEIIGEFSASGRSGSGLLIKTIIKMTAEAFVNAGTGLMADYLSVASDVGNEPAALDWLEEKFSKVVEQTSVGLRQSVMEELTTIAQLADRGDRAIPGAANRAMSVSVSSLKRDASIAFGRVKLRQRRTEAAGTGRPGVSMRDYFISHAGEDRRTCVDPLVNELRRKDRTVWYSEFEITLGDSLLRKIDEGLQNSRFGVVVLSPDFFQKPWPQAELDGLAARAAVEGRKVILPVWHRLSHADVAERSPSLAGLIGIETGRGIAEVADAIIAASDRDL